MVDAWRAGGRRLPLLRRVAAAAALGLLGLHLLASVTIGHAFGNQTINLYARLVPGPDAVRIRWVLDVAEIPALPLTQLIDDDANGTVDQPEREAYLAWWIPSLLENVSLTVNGQQRPIDVTRSELSLPPGEGGAPTLRLVLDLVAPLAESVGGAPVEGGFSDTNYEDFLGWREVVVVPGAGVELLASTAPRVDRTDELRFYPPGLPAEEATSVATFAFVAAPRAEPQPSPSAASEPLLAPTAPGGPGSDLLGSLLAGELTTARAAAAAFVSFLLGVVHALSPGHGKTLVAAALIGSRGSLRHAVALGLTVAVTHSLGVLLLGFAVLGGADLLLPQQLTLALSLAAALLVVVLGLDLVRRAIRRPLNLSPHAHPPGHGHDHGPEDWADQHDDAGVRTDAADEPRGFQLSAGYTISIGVVGGLVPSASALIVLLMAVTLDRLALGLLLVAAYGLGIALLLAALGAAIVALRGRAWRRRLPGGRSLRRLVAVLPLASALAVVAVGMLLTVQVLSAL